MQVHELWAQGIEVVPGRHARAFSGREPNSPLDMMATFGDRGMGRDLAMPGATNGADRIEETLRDGVPAPGRRAPRP